VNLLELIVIGAFAAAVVFLWAKWRVAARAEFIRNYRFPVGLYDKLRKRRPELKLKDCQLVSRGLRQYFLAHLHSGCRFVSMPSQVVDDLWHEFILHTKDYHRFCRRAFGRFMHHTPAVVLGSVRQSNVGLRRCWWYACREENINARAPTRLPLLFALDAKLEVADGFRYTTDCRRVGSAVPGQPLYCGGDFGSPSFDGGTEGFGEADSGIDVSIGGSCGGGGGGCGGGCGGGD
jgi:hypothetical protein